MGLHPLAKELRIDSDKYEKQCEMEMKGFYLGQQRYEDNAVDTQFDKNKDNTLLKPEQTILQKNLNQLAEELTKQLTKLKRNERHYPMKARKFFIEVKFPVDRLAYLVLRYALNISADGNQVQPVCVKLGNQIEKDYEYLQFQSKAKAYLSVVEGNLKSAHMAHRHKVLSHAAKKVILYDEDGNEIGTGIKPLNWQDSMKFAVGKLLLEALTQSTVLFELASRKSRKRVSSARLGFLNVSQLIIRRTKICIDWLEDTHEYLSIFQPVVYPFLIPPKPWSGIEGGGFWTQYKTLTAKLIKTKIKKSQFRVKRHGVKTVNDALNVIQSTKFRINKNVYGVMIEAAKVGLGDLPAPDKYRVEVGEKNPLAEDCPWSDKEIIQRIEANCSEWTQWKVDRSRAYDNWYRNQSKREALLWKLRVAKQFKDELELYFVWNMDYRGRIYCLQPYINPQQDDSGKALLEFAEGKLLDKQGLKHLMIHGANVFGFDKATLNERTQWVIDHEYQILDSAENPLDGQRFWCTGEKPFNFLAFCFEYVNYKQNPDTFESHLPVQQDGTCSGLQHYSALLRDDIGSWVVNLNSTAEKADVYAEVAIIVNEMLNEDLLKGGDERKYAQMWLNVGVDRKICKRNVMTFCYGATRSGFTQQLLDLDLKENLGLPPESVMKACNYLGGVNWAAVAKTLIKSVETMKLLQKIAFFMSKRKYDIQWSNVVGLRVTQDYRKTKTKRIDTWWGGTRISPSIAELTKEKNSVGSRNGIAPNYIHSMDASHLMLTALKCAEEGIVAFSFIHDSFGTHAADMEMMSRILRETFVEMYSEDLLDKFINDVREQLYPEHQEDFDEIVQDYKPEMGSLDVSCVQTSPYFFS